MNIELVNRMEQTPRWELDARSCKELLYCIMPVLQVDFGNCLRVNTINKLFAF